MKEYTLLSILFLILAILMDYRYKTNLLKNKLFYLFLAIIFGFKLVVNGYLTSYPIVIYNPLMFLGIRLGSIPVEDFIFGASMVIMTIVFWESIE